MPTGQFSGYASGVAQPRVVYNQSGHQNMYDKMSREIVHFCDQLIPQYTCTGCQTSEFSWFDLLKSGVQATPLVVSPRMCQLHAPWGVKIRCSSTPLGVGMPPLGCSAALTGVLPHTIAVFMKPLPVF